MWGSMGLAVILCLRVEYLSHCSQQQHPQVTSTRMPRWRASRAVTVPSTTNTVGDCHTGPGGGGPEQLRSCLRASVAMRMRPPPLKTGAQCSRSLARVYSGRYADWIWRRIASAPKAASHLPVLLPTILSSSH